MALPLPSLQTKGKGKLDALLAESIAARTVPSIFLAATNAQETIYENQAGDNVMGESSSGSVSTSSTLEMYSMTKLIVCVAILQLVDQGRLDLDDEEIVYDRLPELGSQEVLVAYDDDGAAITVPQESKITLRMLMNHTAGCTNPQRHPALQRWYRAQPDPAPLNLSTGASIKTLIAPLLFQPGTSWMYSSGTEWLGVLLTRLSGLSLEDYLRQNIFDKVPGSMPDTTFYPRQDIIDRKVAIYKRQPDGSLYRYPNGFSEGRPATIQEVSKEYLSGAGGLFGTTRDYLSFLRALLQCDSRYSPSTGHEPLISPESYRLLFTPSLVDPRPKEEAVKLFKSQHVWSPIPTPDTMNHSVGLALNLVDSGYGRKAGSGGWYGMAHTQYWIDPVTGVAGVCNTQIVGPDPDPWNGVYNAFERTLYDNLITS